MVFWMVGRPSGLFSRRRGWMDGRLSLNRVKWFRERAARDRAREENLKILERRVSTNCEILSNVLSTVWNELAVQSRKDSMGAVGLCLKTVRHVLRTGLRIARLHFRRLRQ